MGKRPFTAMRNAANDCKEIKDFIRLVNFRRKHLNLSQKDLATLSGLTQPTIAQMLSGRHNVSYTAIRHVASKMGLLVSIRVVNRALPPNVKVIKKDNDARDKRNHRRREISNSAKSGIRNMKGMEDE